MPEARCKSCRNLLCCALSLSLSLALPPPPPPPPCLTRTRPSHADNNPKYSDIIYRPPESPTKKLLFVVSPNVPVADNETYS